MELRKSRNEFPSWWIFRLLLRSRKRHDTFYRNTIDRKHINRNSRTWGRSCMANIVKMRYRHGSSGIQNPRNDAWTDAISFQKRRWNQRLDPVNAWQRREFFILEKMNAHHFPKEKEHGSVWTYAVMLQCAMIQRKCNKWRPEHSRSKWWHFHRNLQVRLAGQYRSEKNPRSDWELTILGLQERLRYEHREDQWRGVIWNGYRRL